VERCELISCGENVGDLVDRDRALAIVAQALEDR
jgi:hypothetical protein